MYHSLSDVFMAQNDIAMTIKKTLHCAALVATNISFINGNGLTQTKQCMQRYWIKEELVSAERNSGFCRIT